MTPGRQSDTRYAIDDGVLPFNAYHNQPQVRDENLLIIARCRDNP